MNGLIRVLAPLSVFLAVAGVTFVAVQSMRGGEDEGESVQAEPVPTLDPASALQSEIDADAAKPRFQGEKMGIYVAHSPGDAPADLDLEVRCDGASTELPWEEVGQLGLSVSLPPDFVLQPDDVNTGVVAWACDRQVYAARWKYDFNPTPEAPPVGFVIISRGLLREATVAGGAPATDRVKETDVGGRPALLIEPIRGEGVGELGSAGTQTLIAFPESFGITTVASSGVPLEKVLEIGEIVGKATR